MPPLGALAGLKILVVEDNFLIAEDLASTLGRHGGHVVGPAPRVAVALGLLARESALDGAVLDVNLGGEMCTPVARALVARDVPFVLLTGYDAQSLLPGDFAAAPMLSKPVAEADLINLMGRMFRREEN